MVSRERDVAGNHISFKWPSDFQPRDLAGNLDSTANQQEAQALMAMVPAETHLEIEEMISNRHIGSVEVGQHVAIKADTFNFTPLWPAVWKGCHRRSRRHYPRQATRTSNRATAQGVETSTSEPKGQELIYATRMSLDHTQMKVERRKVNLSPRHGRHGRDQDRIMSYLLSPFIRYKHETLRER